MRRAVSNQPSHTAEKSWTPMTSQCKALHDCERSVLKDTWSQTWNTGFISACTDIDLVWIPKDQRLFKTWCPLRNILKSSQHDIHWFTICVLCKVERIRIKGGQVTRSVWSLVFRFVEHAMSDLHLSSMTFQNHWSNTSLTSEWNYKTWLNASTVNFKESENVKSRSET